MKALVAAMLMLAIAGCLPDGQQAPVDDQAFVRASFPSDSELVRLQTSGVQQVDPWVNRIAWTPGEPQVAGTFFALNCGHESGSWPVRTMYYTVQDALDGISIGEALVNGGEWFCMVTAFRTDSVSIYESLPSNEIHFWFNSYW